MLKLRMECVWLSPTTLPLLVARNNAQRSKKLLPLGLDVNLKALDIQYGKAVEQPLKHFVWVPNNEY